MKTTAEKTAHTQPTRQDHDTQERAHQLFIPPSVQPKLTVNTPGDPYEQEADAIAEQVMSRAASPQMKEAPSLRRQGEQEEELQRKCTDCEEEAQVQRQEVEEEEEMVQRQPSAEEEEVQRQCTDCEEEELQRSPNGDGGTGGRGAPPIVSEVVSSGGKPMDKGARGFMEYRFGADFSHVQIHEDDKAQRSASAISAEAYTYGSHIVFARGKYEPESQRGKHLLAHELTHVLQQDKSVKRRIDPAANANPATESNAPLPNAAGPPPIQAEAQPASAGPSPIPAGAEAPAPPAPSLPTVAELEPLMPPPPEALGPEAQARLRQSQRNAGAAAEANADMPAAEELTSDARSGVTEPEVETGARASGQLTASMSERLAPSPEIEALCEDIRRVIREKRPPDEDSLLQADPEEAAQEAGTQLNDNIDSDVERVKGEYDELDESPTGEAEQVGAEIVLPPEEVGEPNLRAAGAAPDPLTEEDVSLDADVEASAQQMEEAGMTTPVAEVIEDGPVAESRAVHEELETTAAEDPALVLAEQDLAIAGAQADMEMLQAQALQALESARTGTVRTSGSQQTDMVGSEEEQRAALGAQAEEIFTNAQTQVNDLLAPLTDTAMQMWEAGKARVAWEFERHLARVQRWVDERYSGTGGGVVELWDDLTGMPDWVTDEYDDAERTFGDDICDLIREISLHVNGIIVTCEEIIDTADRGINDLFDSAPAELAEWAAAERERFQGRLDGLREEVSSTQQSFNEDLANRAAQAVQEVREQVHALREAAKGLLGQIADAIAEFLEDPIRAIINGLLRLVGIEPAAFWALAARIEQVMEDIANDPLGFASNLMAAIGQGFGNFFNNFFTHLFDGFINWIFSGLGAVGVEIPKDLSLSGIITFFLQLMGITWERIRMLLARHIGEENVALLEQAYEIITDLIELGPEGVFELIKDQLDPRSILDQVIEMAVDFVVETLIKQATIRIAMLFNPVGAIAQAIEAIYRVLSWIFENAARIFTLVETVVNGIADIVAGNIAGMAATVENALTQILVPVIDFVAGYMGLGGLPERVADMVRGLQNWIEGILDRVIGWLAAQARSILSALGISEDADPEGEGENAGELEDTEVGEVVTFSVDEKQHRMWVDTAGMGVEIMLRSTPMTVGEKLAEWNGKLDGLSEEDKSRASGLLATAQSQYETTKREGAEAEQELEEARNEANAENIAEANQADEEVEAAQQSLKGTLVQLFEVFGEEPIDFSDIRETFTTESNETHSLFFEEEGGEPELMIASEKRSFRAYINQAIDTTDPQKVQAKNALLQLLDQLDALKEEREEDTKQKVEGKVQEMETQTRILYQVRFSSEPEFDGVNSSGYGTAVTMHYLSKVPPLNTSGSSPTSSHTSDYAVINQRRSGGGSFYVKGHLLSEKLHGPGVWDNLTPLSRSANANHDRKVESKLKGRVAAGEVFFYRVNVVYGRPINLSLITRLNAMNHPQQDAIREVLITEQTVPQRMTGYYIDVNPLTGLPAEGEGHIGIDVDIQDTSLDDYQIGNIIIEEPDYPMNLATASERDLQFLPGVGPALAANIRKAYLDFGPFETESDLIDNTVGLGRVTLDKMKNHKNGIII